MTSSVQDASEEPFHLRGDRVVELYHSGMRVKGKIKTSSTVTNLMTFLLIYRSQT